MEAKPKAEKPDSPTPDWLAQAEKAARADLEAMTARYEPPKPKTLLTGFGRYSDA